MAGMCIALAVLRRPVSQAWNNMGHADWMRASPFTDVLVQGDAAFVEFLGARYELISINGASTAEILDSARDSYGASYGEKRFIEDLPEVLDEMGFNRKATVSLVLRDAEGNLVDIPEAPMTAQNRNRVYRAQMSRER
jgi:hypothetical protein